MYGHKVYIIAQWESTLDSHPELQNWAGGTFKLKKLLGINSRFALIDKKAQELKWLKN